MLNNVTMVISFVAGVAILPWDFTLFQSGDCHRTRNTENDRINLYWVNNAPATPAQWGDAWQQYNFTSVASLDEYQNAEMEGYVEASNRNLANVTAGIGVQEAQATLRWEPSRTPDCSCCHWVTAQSSWFQTLAYSFSRADEDLAASGEVRLGTPAQQNQTWLEFYSDGCPNDCPTPDNATGREVLVYSHLRVTITQAAGAASQAQVTIVGSYLEMSRLDGGAWSGGDPVSMNENFAGSAGTDDTTDSTNVPCSLWWPDIFHSNTTLRWTNTLRLLQVDATSNIEILQGRISFDAWALRLDDAVEGENIMDETMLTVP